MAISMTAPVAEAQVAAKVGELSQELQFLLDGADVSSGFQANISECGILSPSLLASLGQAHCAHSVCLSGGGCFCGSGLALPYGLGGI